MTRRSLALVTLALMAPRLALACSACGCGDTGLTNLGLQFAHAGQWRVTMEYRSSGQTIGVANDPSEFSDEKERRASLIASYAPTPRLVARAIVPGVVHRAILDGDTQTTDDATSFGDVELQARYELMRHATHARSTTLTAIGGVGAPTGANDVMHDGARLDEHVQPGTGAWSGSGGLALTSSSARTWIYGSLTAKSFAANDHHFTYGRGLLLTSEAGHHVSPAVAVLAGVAGRTARRDRHLDMTEAMGAPAAPGVGTQRPTHGDVDANGYLLETGGTVAFATPGAQVRVAPGALWRVVGYFPIWQHLNGTQKEKSSVQSSITVAW